MAPCSWNMLPWWYVCILTIIKWCVRLNGSSICKDTSGFKVEIWFVLLVTKYQMQVWCIKCRYGVSNAGMVCQMQVWCIKCRYVVSNAGMVYQMQVWCIKCRYGVSNAGMVYQMQVWCIKCRYGVSNAGMVHQLWNVFSFLFNCSKTFRTWGRVRCE